MNIFFEEKKISYLLIVFCILPLSLDFRAEATGGGSFQYLLAFLTVISVLLINRGSTDNLNKGGFGYVIYSTIAFSVVNLFLNGVIFDHYIRVIFPYLLFLIGFVLVSKINNSVDSLIFLYKVIKIGCFISCVFTFCYAIFVLGVPISEARYQILSSTTQIFFSIIIFELLILNKKNLLNFLFLFFDIGLMILSATRSQILSSVIILIVATWLSCLKSNDFTRKIISIFSYSLAICCALFLALSLISTNLTDKWTSRFFQESEVTKDLTTSTRLAEIDFQVNEWVSTPLTFIFGKGIGATYMMDGEELKYLRDILGDDLLLDRYFEAGHNFWIYSLFSSGVLFGFALPLSIIYLLYISYVRMVNLKSSDSNNVLMVNFLYLSFLVVLSFITSTIGGNPLGPRYSGLLYGVFFGLLVMANSYIKHDKYN